MINEFLVHLIAVCGTVLNARCRLSFEKVIALPLVTMFTECRAFVWLRASLYSQ